jgi:exopolyphosphatase/guanosine-5'-triphosphate,3'-diphosphate pyrophosphatase
VESAAMQFLTQVKSSWNIDDEEHAQVLSWSARLHEWGKTISHTGYHKHGAYLSLNSDLQGFSLSEQQLISVLIRSHRRKLSLANFDCLSKSLMLHAVNLCILLRLAVILHRSRLTTPLPEIKLKAKDKDILLTFPDNWLDSHALTLADLQRETDILKENGYNLTISQSLTAQL